MDLNMPFMDGYQATRQIRKLYADYNIEQPRIVICTGHVETDYIQEAWRCGANEIMTKPVDS